MIRLMRLQVISSSIDCKINKLSRFEKVLTKMMIRKEDERKREKRAGWHGDERGCSESERELSFFPLPCSPTHHVCRSSRLCIHCLCCKRCCWCRPHLWRCHGIRGSSSFLILSAASPSVSFVLCLPLFFPFFRPSILTFYLFFPSNRRKAASPLSWLVAFLVPPSSWLPN